MNKKILTIAMIALFSLGLTVLANTIFSIDDAFFTETGISSGDYSPLNFNYGGNNFDGIIFWGDKVNNTGELTLGGNTVNCDKQFKGLYINTARGNKIWPLDQDTLDILSGSSSFSGYNQLTMTGGFFTECVGSGFTVDVDEIYGYISHEYAGETFELWAGIDYDFANNIGTGAFSGSLKYITGILNDTAEGYVFDDHGGIADVRSSLDIYGNANFTGTNVTYTGGNNYTEDDDVMLNIYSNLNVIYEISGDVASVSTGVLTAGNTINQNLTLSSGNGLKTIVYTITDGTDTFTETLTVLMFIPDTTPPTVNLTYPINGGLSMLNSVQFQWACTDTDVDHFDLHIDSSNSGANYVWTNLSPTINSMMVNNMLDDDYTWYVIGTDTSGNTGQSTTYYLTISGVAVGPDLISPANNASIEFGTLILDWENTNSASGYTWQIATDSSFVNIVASDTTTGTAVQTIHNPNFMTGTFYWRIIDNSTNGISTYRKINITTPSGGIDLRTDEFEFSDKNNAEVSESYTSNHITIEGINNNVYIPVKLEDSIGALFINDDMVGSQGFVKLNDEVYVELISSNIYDNLVSTKLIIGEGNNKVSDEYDVRTKTGVNNNNNGFTLSYTQKLQAIMLIQNIIDMYGNNQTKLVQFLTTFQSVIQDKSDLLKIDVLDTNDPQELELLNGQIASLDYLYNVITDYLNNLPHGVDDIYIAPNGKQYRVVFDENRFAYTSPDFRYPDKYFPTWELFTRHIDINNPGYYTHNYHGGSGIDSSNGERIEAPNAKVYYIHVVDGKRVSDQFAYAKSFDTRDEIVNYIYANNPSGTWNHRLDTSFTPVEFRAQNGKKYSIFKTLASGPNGNKYSSFNFVTPKYFDSLQSAKNHIMNMNR